MGKPHFYHYATEGLKDDVLFGSVAEFIAGMNRIAVCLCRLGPAHPVQVICFVLMDNHVHFILYGLEEDCDLFMESYKQTTELWLRHHGGDNSPGKIWRIGPQSTISLGTLLPQGWRSLLKDIAGVPHRSCSPT